MSEEEFLLKWNDHHSSFFTIVEDLCRTEQLCDVTLACGGQVFETHKLILSVCSPYFRTLLQRQDKHPIVYLKDVNPKHLEQLLSYMYRGEINVLQNDLGPLIETARGLQIKGLADAGGGDKRALHNGGVGGGQGPKRARTTTPTPVQAKVPKIDSQPKSVDVSPAVTYTPPSREVVEVPQGGLVKQEDIQDDEGEWDENIPNDNYEAELQMEDEQYIRPEGLSGQQILMLQREIQKKYPCEFCHKRFPTPSKLHRHKLVHSGEKPYICAVCLKGFTQKVHLNTHKKLAHPDLPPDLEGREGKEGPEGQFYSGSDSESSLFIHTDATE